MPLNYHEKRKARGMLADKQGINSIAEELDCNPSEIQALADAKPKAVRPPLLLSGRDLCAARRGRPGSSPLRGLAACILRRAGSERVDVLLIRKP